MRRHRTTLILQQFALLFVSLVFFTFISLQTATAISPEQRQLINSGVNYYNIGDTPQSTCEIGVNASFQGSENTEMAFNFFREQGLTSEQSAGIVGNLIAESGVMPNRKQGSGMQTIDSITQIEPEVGFGIAQWTSGGRQQAWINYAEELGMDALGIELQLLFLLNELENNSGYGYSEIQDADTTRQAAWVFMAFFERPAVVVDNGYATQEEQPTANDSAKEELDHRTGNANRVLELYSSNPVIENRCGVAGSTGTPDFSSIPGITVDGSPAGSHSESNCTGSFTPGAESLADFVMDTWSPPVTSVGGYHCRSIVGGSRTSIHGLGRAIDIMVDATAPEGLRNGDEIRNYLINNALELGIQRVIWNRHIWSADQDGWRDYSGQNPHTDHLHVEVNIEASTDPNLADIN